MNWQCLILINAVLQGSSVIIMRALARDKRYSRASFVMNAGQYVALWAAGLSVLLWTSHVETHMLSQYFWRFVGGGVAFALTNVAMYKTLTYVDAAIGSIFGMLNAPFTVIVAAIAIHEDLTALQLVGGVVLTMAVIYSLLALRPRRRKTSGYALEHALLFASIAAVFYAIAIVNEKSLLMHMSVGSYVVFGWGWQVVASFVTAAIVQRRQFKLLRDMAALRLVGLMGALRGIGGASFVLAQTRGSNVAALTTISNFKLIIVVILGAWILKERQKLAQKFVGATAAIAGVSLMFWK